MSTVCELQQEMIGVISTLGAVVWEHIGIYVQTKW